MAGNENMGKGVAFVLLATLGWSLSGLFVRLMPGLDGWQINCWRGFWMACGLLAYLALIHGTGLWARFRAIPLAALVISSICFAAGTTFYVMSLTYASTATVSVIGATSPLLTALFAPWINGERTSALSWMAAIIALGGMAVIAQHGIEAGNPLGIILAACVPATFSLQTMLLRRYRDHDMMMAICLGGFLAFLAAAFASALPGHASAFAIDARSFGLLMLMGPLQLTIPLIFYGFGARHVPAITLSLIAMLDAVINPFWTWLFAGERPEVSALIGGAIILGAVLLSTLGSRLLQLRAA